MKQFLRYSTLAVLTVFAFGMIQAQTTLMTKAQAMGLKSSGINVTTPAAPSVTTVRAMLLEEGFDGTWLPAGWSVINPNTNPILNWLQTNPADDALNFDNIDPNSLFSAMVSYATPEQGDQDEWLISPEMDAMGEMPVTLEFYAGSSGFYLTGATLRCLISTDGGNNWMELWNAIDVIDPEADWAWHLVTIPLDAYVDGETFQIAWNYVGNDGGDIGLDGVSVFTGYNWVYYTDFEDDYEVGDYVADDDPTGFWSTWSGATGGTEDAFVVDDESTRGSQSAEVEGSSTDLLLLMGDKTSGEYYLQAKYYVESGFGGYINIQHYEAAGVEWAHEVYFGAADGADNGYMLAGAPDQMPFTFPHDQWITLSWNVDLDDDWIQFFIDDVMLHEWQFSLQADGSAGTLQLGSFDIFAGAPTGDEVHYYFDEVGFAVVTEGSVEPVIEINNSPIIVALPQWGSTTETFSMGNIGEDDLEYQIVTTYTIDTKAPSLVPAGQNSKYPKVLNNEYFVKPNPTPTPQQNASREDILRYDDGANAAAIGNAADQEWRVAARFPADMVQPYIGMEIYKVDVYIATPSISHKLQIYGMGSFNTPGPGDLLYEQEFVPAADNWNTIVLDEPLPINGENIWVGYWFDKPADVFTPGADAGPANPNGDWISHGVGWSHLYNPDDPDPLNYNWNIAAYLQGEPIVQWLSTDPTDGVLAQDEFIDVEVMIDAASLAADSYFGKLKVRSNDKANEEVKITVVLNVTVGVNENGEKEYIVIYPNPASDILRIGSNGNIQHVRMMNSLGQVVFDREMNDSNTQVDIGSFRSGVYFIQVDTDHGTTTQKFIVE